MPSIADGPLTSLALCWRVERGDGAGLALTSHDAAIVHDGDTFVGSPGMVPGTITRGLGLEPHEGEIAGALNADALSEADLALGRWDGARVTLTAVDWIAPEVAPVALLGGELGEVASEGEAFSAELRGAAWRLSDPVCPSTSPECRAELGDKQCRVDLAGRSVAAAVVVRSGTVLTLDAAFDDRFVFGRLRYLAGDNTGVSTVILAVAGNQVTVRDVPRAAVAAGCRVELREGCDKRFATCVARFDNALNFRGEPHLPGNDLLTRYPGA
ncbi:MAG: DUF2163 domain-containing protein [Sphingomicrobium sp.]